MNFDLEEENLIDYGKKDIRDVRESHKRCGEVYMTENDNFKFICILCEKMIFTNIKKFLIHLMNCQPKTEIFAMEIDPLNAENNSNSTKSNYKGLCLEDVPIESEDYVDEDPGDNQNSSELFSCDYCEKTYSWEKSLKKHVKEKHRNKTYVPQSIKSENEINIEKNMFSCEYCENSYSWEKSLKKHVREKHSNNVKENIAHSSSSVYKKCTINFVTTEYSDDEMNGDLSVSKKNFKTKKSLQIHKNFDHDEDDEFNDEGKIFSCEFCERIYNWEKSLKKHVKEKHPNKTYIPQLIKSEKEINIKRDMFSCEYCENSYSWEKSLKKHVREKHSNNIQESIVHPSSDYDESKIAECSEEQKLDDEMNRKNVSTTQKQTQNVNICDFSECKKKFKTEEDLQLHKDFDHDLGNGFNNEDNIYSCKFCGKIYTWKKALKKHVKEKHLNYTKKQTVHLQSDFEEPETVEYLEDQKLDEEIKQEYVNTTHNQVQNVKLSCDFSDCKKTFKTEEDLQLHKSVDHDEDNEFNMEENIFPCKICKKTYKWKKALKKHVKQKHINYVKEKIVYRSSDYNEPRIDSETAEYSDKNMIQNQVQKVIICDYSDCRKKFKTAENLQLHKDLDHDQDNEQNIFSCKLCNKMYTWKKALKKHVKEKHLNYVKRKIVHTPSNYDKSKVESETAEYLEKEKLNDEMNQGSIGTTHNQVQSVNICDFSGCKKKFKTKEDLELHKSVDHDEDNEFNTEENIFPCKICKRTYKWKKALKKHVKQKHLNIENGEFVNDESRGDGKDFWLNKMDVFKCRFCNKTFRTSENQELHEKIHEGIEYKCDLCALVFANMYAYKNHVQRHFASKKKCPCKYCDKSFYTNFERKCHEKIHTGEKSYQCHQCGRLFSLQTKLNHHMRLHSGIKPFKCDQCGRGFSFRRYLRDHYRIHTNERPFPCQICNSKFSRKKSLKIHMKIHSEFAKYVCKICGKAFKQSSGLYCHMKNHAEILC